MFTHIVTKKFSGPNGDQKIGTEVDASEWRNTPMLVKQRYLKPLDGVEAPAEVSQTAINELPSDFDQRITEVILNDLRQGGPIAQVLKSVEFGAGPVQPTDKQKRAQK